MTTLAVTTPRPAPEILSWSRTAVDPVLRTAVDELPGSIRLVAGYHLGWWDAGGVPTAGSGGKAIRPAVALLCAAAVGGDPVAAAPAAAAIELVHNFSLLHDDVMDRDVTRRHRPTAWRVFGVNAAVLTGDALLTLAFGVVAGSGNPAARDGTRTLSRAVLRLIGGQSADLAFERRADVTVDECVRMALDKTGALLGCASGLGAAFGGGRRDQVVVLRDFGERLGLAFQHVDDLLGIWGDPAVTGKPVYTDLGRGKKSLPVVAALTSGTAAGQELRDAYALDEPITGDGLARAAELVELAGGRTWSRTQADHLLAEALARLRTAGSPSRPCSELANLAQLLVHREC